MDRWRAAGALLALAACFACSAAAPTASNQTSLDLYEGAPEGCYYNFQHYGEGDRIMTNEPCLNCTCHNRMLMCYLRVCPFTKAIGQDCTVEKRADQCCPIVTCPDVPVDLLTSTSTTSPAEYGATGLGKLDKYGCSINGKYFPEGSKVPPTPNKPCEHCYCIRNMTTCVMQECTLHVDGCTPIYHKDVCCPIRYSCDHPEDEVPLLDDMSTTVRPTPGFLLTTTTVSPVTQMTQDCVHDDQIFADGALIKTEKACEHCYCMKGDIVCVVQECGAPMENEGKNCTSLPPREGQCCPDTYICEGDELSSDLPTESTTDALLEKLTTLAPPRRSGVEGSGYRNEPDEVLYTEMPTIETEQEGSGEEQETTKPVENEETIPVSEDGDQYISVTTKSPIFGEHEQPTTEVSINTYPDENVDNKTNEPDVYISTTKSPLKEEIETATTEMMEQDNLEPNKHIPTTSAPQVYEKVTTESGESLNTVPGVILEEETNKPQEHTPSTTSTPTIEESESLSSVDGEEVKTTPSEKEFSTPTVDTSDKKETDTSVEVSSITPDIMTEKEYSETDSDTTTSAIAIEETESPYVEDKESSKPTHFVPSTTSIPIEEGEQLTTEPDHAQNTVDVAEDESTHPHLHIQNTTNALPSVDEESTTVSNLAIVTDKVNNDGLIPQEHVTTASPALEEKEFTTMEPDKGLNTIPNEANEETSSEPSLPERTTTLLETKSTELPIVTDGMQSQDVDIKRTTSFETATLLPENITKGDQYTITTEPSFRKEDEGSISTEKAKEFESTTVKAEFVDEGLIPTSVHDETFGTSSDGPSTEEELTTVVPEYTKEIDEIIGSKQTTTESVLETSVVTESLSSKTPEQEGEITSSTEKTAEVTAIVSEDIDTHEEPVRIPGEGDCLLNGVTYGNNTVVPSTNNCHTGCRCASSIIKCDPIICSPPPDYMDNCQSIYDSPDSCCPTYVCDHPRETVPPQSDNQMSGTESPMPSPTIECRGDQCEIIEPAKQPTPPSEICASGHCSTETDHKLECGSDGCSNVPQKPDLTLPTVEQTEECTDGKCRPDSCTDAECQLPQTEGQASPIKPCDGEHCEKDGVISPPLPQMCENEEDCKTLDIPVIQTTSCEGDSCKKIDCGDSGCDSNVISPPQDTQHVPCKDESGCKPHDITALDCTGDEPCRRKEISSTEEKLPSECEGSNCVHGTETTLSEQMPSVQVTENEVATGEEKATELPEIHRLKPDVPVKDSQDKDTYTTEGLTDTDTAEEDSQKEKPAVMENKDTNLKEPVESVTNKPGLIAEEDEDKPDVDEDSTNAPAVIEKEISDKPVVVEEGTLKPITVAEEGTETPLLIDDKDKVVFEEETKKPAMVGEEVEAKPASTEEGIKTPPSTDEDKTGKPIIDQETDKPMIVEEGPDEPTVEEDKATEKPTSTDAEDQEKATVAQEEGTNTPVIEVSTHKPSVLISEGGKDKPVIDIEEGTEEPMKTDEEGKEKPAVSVDIDVKKPADVETEGTEQPVIIQDEGTEKPVTIVEDGKEKPDIVEEGTELPDIHIEDTERSTTGEEESTKNPIIIDEEGAEIPFEVDEEHQTRPSVTLEESTGKPVIDEDDKEKPAIIDKEDTEKPAIGDEVGKTKPTETEKQHIEKPTVTDEQVTEKPFRDDEEGKEKPVIDEEKSSESPAMIDDVEKTTEKEEHREKPAVADEQSTENPVLVEEGTEKPVVDEEKSSESPSKIDEQGTDRPTISEQNGTEIPIIFTEEGKEKPTVDEKGTEEPAIIEREGTEQPDIIKDVGTQKPALTDKEDKEQPANVNDESTAAVTEEALEIPVATDDQGEKEPGVFEKEITEKPAEEENTDKPAIIDEENKEKPGIVDEERTTKPVTEAASTEKPAVFEEDGTMKPVMVETEKTEQPALIDEEGKLKPTFDEEEDIKKPEVDTEKPFKVEEKDKEKPALIDEDLTEKPVIDEADKKEPQAHEEEEGSGTDMPEIVEPEKESKLPDVLIKPTESSVTESEKETKTPIYDSQTTAAEDTHAYTEPNAVDYDTSAPLQETVSSVAPEIKVTDSQDDHSKVPQILEHSYASEIATETSTEQEFTTQTHLSATVSEETVTSVSNEEKEMETITISAVTEPTAQFTSPVIGTSDSTGEGSTIGQDMTFDEAVSNTKAPELYETTEAVEKVTKTTEIESISEHEVFTDTTKLESLTTKTPEVDSGIHESQGKVTDKPEQPVTGKMEEEGTTKVYEEDKIKPIPESHVTEVTKYQTIIPEYETTSALPEQYETSEKISEIPEIPNENKEKTESPETHDAEPEKVFTQLPVDISKEEIKTDYPDVYKPGKEEITTESSVYPVTEPVRSYTEIEDSFVTGQEDKVTEYPEAVTEHRVPSTIEKIDESEDKVPVSSETPLLTDEPLVGVPEQSTHLLEIEKEKPEIFESQEISQPTEKDIIGHEEKTTSIPNLTEPEGYTEELGLGTEIPNYHVTVSEDHSKAPESHITEQYATKVQETSTKSEEPEITDTQPVTTETSRTSVKEEEPETKAPQELYTESHYLSTKEESVTESEKPSSEMPVSSEEAHTEIPSVQLTTKIPQSLVTEHHEDLGAETTVSSLPKQESTSSEILTTQFQEATQAPELHVSEQEIQTETPHHITESVEPGTTESIPEISKQEDKVTEVSEAAVTEKQDTPTTLHETPIVTPEEVTEKQEADMKLPETTTVKQVEEIMTEHTSAQTEFSETTPYFIELEKYTHKIVQEITTVSPSEEEHTYKTAEDISTPSSSEEDHTHKIIEHISTVSPSEDEDTSVHPEVEEEITTKKITDESIETATKKAESTSRPIDDSSLEDVSEKITESSMPVEETTLVPVRDEDHKYSGDHKEGYTTSAEAHISEETTPTTITEKAPVSESDVVVPTEKEPSSTEKPLRPIVPHETSLEDEFIFSTTKATTLRQDEEILTPVTDDKFAKPEEKPTRTSEVPSVSTTTEVPKPGVSDMQPTDEIPASEEDGQFPPSGTSGYGEPDYVEEDQAIAPGTCRYGGKVYVSAQQIPRDDPCDFCFCFRSDIICLQQSCPPPIHGCHEEPIQGFCCPRYECPVSMATTVNVTTTTTTTTTTLPPHFPTHSYKGAAQRRGCQIKGHTYKVGEVVRSSSGPCLHCTCGGDGQMKCDPKACTPEPMLRQMIAAAVSAKRRR